MFRRGPSSSSSTYGSDTWLDFHFGLSSSLWWSVPLYLPLSRWSWHWWSWGCCWWLWSSSWWWWVIKWRSYQMISVSRLDFIAINHLLHPSDRTWCSDKSLSRSNMSCNQCTQKSYPIIKRGGGGGGVTWIVNHHRHDADIDSHAFSFFSSSFPPPAPSSASAGEVWLYLLKMKENQPNIWDLMDFLLSSVWVVPFSHPITWHHLILVT